MGQKTFNTIYTIIDTDGLFDFFKDKIDPDLGKSSRPYKVDSFCTTMAPGCYYGPNSNIPILEPNSKYTWKVQSLNGKDEVSYKDNSDPIIIMEMITKIEDKDFPKGEDWKKIFFLTKDLYEKKPLSLKDCCYFLDHGKLNVTKKALEDVGGLQDKNSFQATFVTNAINKYKSNYYNLSYSIKFTINHPNEENKKCYCIYDPFIKVRSDGETD